MSDKRFYTLTELTHLPQPTWLIEGICESGSLAMLAGPSGSFKSFLALDWLLCMAAGRSWSGRTTVPCKVGYALGEGKSNLLKRIRAWVKFNKVSSEELENVNSNFKATFEVPQLASKASVDNLLADLEKDDFKPTVLVIDTFARSFVGLDENDQKDTGLWIESADRLRQLGYTVIFIHHTRKNTEFGVQERGSSTIKAAMDSSMILTADKIDGTCSLKLTKQKDHDEGHPIRFRRVLVPEEDSMVLVEAPIMDERFNETTIQVKPVHKVVSISMDDPIPEIVKKLVDDQSYVNDKARAEELRKLTGLTFSAAATRVSRGRKEASSTNCMDMQN